MRNTAVKTSTDQLNALTNTNPATGDRRRVENEKKNKRKGLKGDQKGIKEEKELQERIQKIKR